MKRGEMEYAIRKAHNSFDAWNDTTGIFAKHTGYYYEALAQIETSVRIGARVASGLDVQLEEDGSLIDNDPLSAPIDP